MNDIPDFKGRELLSRRQLEIVQFGCHGVGCKETAKILGISPRTVEFHREEVYSKLNIHSMPKIVAMVYGGNHGE
jgi:two-component system response regulator FixJ